MFALMLAVASHAAVPADSTLPLCYERESVEAIFSQKPAQMAGTLEAHPPKAEKGRLVEVSHHLLLAHLYSEQLGDAARAQPHFKTSARLLAGASFAPRALERQAPGPVMSAALPGLTWALTRRAWVLYGELGLFGGDAESLRQGEALFDKLPAGVVRRQPWLVPAGGARGGALKVSLERVHPNQTDKALAYALPFLAKLQTFKLTVSNTGSQHVEFGSDDLALELDGKRIPAVSVGELGPATLVNGLRLQQFLYPELTPYTLSELGTAEFNDVQYKINSEKAAAIRAQREEAHFQAIMDRAIESRAQQAMLGVGIARIGTEMARGIKQVDIRQDRDKAAAARSQGRTGAANFYETRARWEEENMRQDRAREERWTASASAGGGTSSGGGRAPAGASGGATIDEAAWAKSASDRVHVLERRIAMRLAVKKLERFLNSDSLLPHKGTRLRLPAGKTWTGLVSFPTPTAAPRSAKLHLAFDGAPSTVLPLAVESAVAFVPPLLSYGAPTFVNHGPILGEAASGDIDQDWYVLLPELLPEENQ